MASKNVRDFQMSSRNFMKQICFDTKCDALQNFIFSKTRIDPREFRHVQCSKQFPSNLVLNISRLILRPHVSGYFWIRNFFFPDTASVRRIRWMLHTNPQILNPLSRVEIFWIRCMNPESCRYFLSRGGGGGVTRLSPVLYRKYSRRRRAQCYRFFTSWTSVSSLITSLQLNLAMITVHFNYAKRRLDILKWTDELDAINKIIAK